MSLIFSFYTLQVYQCFQGVSKRITGIRWVDPLNANPTKYSNSFKQFAGSLPTNCLSMLDHFVGLNGLYAAAKQEFHYCKLFTLHQKVFFEGVCHCVCVCLWLLHLFVENLTFLWKMYINKSVLQKIWFSLSSVWEETIIKSSYTAVTVMLSWLAKLMNFCGGSEAVLKNQVSGFNNIKLTDMYFSEIFLFWNLGIYLWPKVSHWSQICSAYEPACIWIWLYLKFYQQNCKYNTHWVTNGKSGTEGILAINNVHWTFF